MWKQKAEIDFTNTKESNRSSMITAVQFAMHWWG